MVKRYEFTVGDSAADKSIDTVCIHNLNNTTRMKVAAQCHTTSVDERLMITRCRTKENTIASFSTVQSPSMLRARTAVLDISKAPLSFRQEQPAT